MTMPTSPGDTAPSDAVSAGLHTEYGEQVWAGRLERGDLLYFPRCPFALPTGDDLRFLLEQGLGSFAHKNISFDPKRDRVAGFRRHSPAYSDRLRQLLSRFSHDTTQWLAGQLPSYATSWKPDRVSFRPEEEATRKLRPSARNDLLHVDAFPSRPTNGARLLRLFVNINPTEPRIWATSDTFAKLFARFGMKAGLPTPTSFDPLGQFERRVLGLFSPGHRDRSPYDAFMLRFHNFLKANEELQEKGPKRLWKFAPGSAWLLFSDTLSHAALRGRFALEHSYFVSQQSLFVPAESPAAVLEAACGRSVINRAA